MKESLFFVLFLLAIYAIYSIIKYISSYPQRKRAREFERARREEEAAVQEILGGFNVDAERERIINLLEAGLPNAYRCGRHNCGGILLKRTGDDDFSHYYCTECHNFRTTIRKVGLD